MLDPQTEVPDPKTEVQDLGSGGDPAEFNLCLVHFRDGGPLRWRPFEMADRNLHVYFLVNEVLLITLLTSQILLLDLDLVLVLVLVLSFFLSFFLFLSS